MTDTSNRNRQAGGQPIGGQFATEARGTDTGVSLDADTPIHQRPATYTRDEVFAAKRDYLDTVIDAAIDRRDEVLRESGDGPDVIILTDFVAAARRERDINHVHVDRELTTDPTFEELDVEMPEIVARADDTYPMSDHRPLSYSDADGNAYTMTSRAIHDVLDEHDRRGTRPVVCDGPEAFVAIEDHVAVCRDLSVRALRDRPTEFAMTRRPGSDVSKVETPYGTWTVPGPPREITDDFLAGNDTTFVHKGFSRFE